LGCGPVFLRGYLNIGYWTQLAPGVAYKDPNGVTGTVLLNHDLSKGIPAADNSLDVIYHSHFLEHLTYKEGWSFLKECHEKLKPGGVHRIVVPDLELWINSYFTKDQFIFEKYREEVLDNDKEMYSTRAAIFMGMLHNHEHKCGWDYETLEYVLSKVGFKQIRRTMFQESSLQEIKEIEPYGPLRALESLCVECLR
jgi:predicted SAM-dependent methyltransferase